MPADPEADFDPSWSPDGRRIAYRHEGGGGDSSNELLQLDRLRRRDRLGGLLHEYELAA